MKFFTDQEKVACLQREIRMRKHVYPGCVRQGLMQPSAAEREINLMEAILADYINKLEPALPLSAS